jgi:hypothetical protein
VGLAARLMEENALSSVVLTPMPEFHNAVGIPRSVAIEYPFGRVVGQVNDVTGQQRVLEQTLSILEKAETPGEIRHLDFVWPEDPKKTDWHPPEISPIIKQNLDVIKKIKVE